MSLEWGRPLAYRVYKYRGDDSTANVYGAKALLYMTAMVRDNAQGGAVGSGGGGLHNIQIDSGWTARTVGLGTALIYDWLYDYAPFNNTLKTEFYGMLNTWITWYDANGYDRSDTLVGTNYNGGYFIMKAMAGYATEGDNGSANTYIAWANNIWDNFYNVKLTTGSLRGGDWLSSGWNYGPGMVQKFFGYLMARKTATGIDNVINFSWGRDHVYYKIGGLHPDRKHVYGGGSWSSDSGADYVTDRDMVYVSYALKGTKEGEYTQWYIQNLVDPPSAQRAMPWEYFLWYLPSRTATDYRPFAPLQWRAQGSGVTTMRSSWL